MTDFNNQIENIPFIKALDSFRYAASKKNISILSKAQNTLLKTIDGQPREQGCQRAALALSCINEAIDLFIKENLVTEDKDGFVPGGSIDPARRLYKRVSYGG